MSKLREHAVYGLLRIRQPTEGRRALLFMRHRRLLRSRQLLPDRTNPHKAWAACRSSCSGSSRRLTHNRSRSATRWHGSEPTLDQISIAAPLSHGFALKQSLTACESLSNGWDDASTKFYSVDGMLSSVPSLEFRSPIMMIVTLTLESAIGASFIVYGLSEMLNH